MRKTLEDLYYGSIIPNEQQMTPGSELKRAVDRVTKYENQLMEQLRETEQEILTKLIRSQHDINSITATENFILGFRLGVRLMAECMDRKDGRWEGRYTAGYDSETGKRIIKNVLGKTQAEVKEKLAQAQQETAGLDVGRSEDYTVASWLRSWYELYAKPNVRSATADRDHLAAHLVRPLRQT